MKKDGKRITWIYIILAFIMIILSSIAGKLNGSTHLFPYYFILKDSLGITNHNQLNIKYETGNDILLNFEGKTYYYKTDNTGTVGMWENEKMVYVYFIQWRRYRQNQPFKWWKLKVLK